MFVSIRLRKLGEDQETTKEFQDTVSVWDNGESVQVIEVGGQRHCFFRTDVAIIAIRAERKATPAKENIFRASNQSHRQHGSK